MKKSLVLKIVFSISVSMLNLSMAMGANTNDIVANATTDHSIKLNIVDSLDSLEENDNKTDSMVSNRLYEDVIYMKAKVKKNEVLLRWAVSDYSIWDKALESGFGIEKLSFKKGDSIFNSRVNLIEIPGFKTIDTSLISAYSENNFIALWGELVYGERLSLEMQGSPLLSAYRSVEDRQMRFSLTMLACDRSFMAALFAGFAYRDTNVSKDYSYVYRLYLNDSICRDTAAYFTNMQAYTTLPPLQKISAIKNQSNVIISWDTRFLAEQMTGYYIERKRNGEKFKRLNKTPISKLQADGSDYILNYIDSLTTEDKYVYRILGVDLFNDEYVISEECNFEEVYILKSTPKIIGVMQVEDNKLILRWDFPKSEEEALEGYILSKKNSMYADYTVVSRVSNVTKRFVGLNTEDWGNSSYLCLTALGKNGEEKYSNLFFYQKKDSIPPQIPKYLEFIADTIGAVFISWNTIPKDTLNNTIKSKSVQLKSKAILEEGLLDDVAYYNIYRAVAEDAIFLKLNTDPLNTAIFYDTLPLNTRKNFYYKVMAIDLVGNESALSETLEVRLPLANIPSAAVFGRCEKRKNSINLTWFNSMDSDVKGHRLYLKIDNSSWLLLKDFKKDDNKVVAGKDSFLYQILEHRQYATSYEFDIVAYTSEAKDDRVSCAQNYTALVTPIAFTPKLFAEVDRDERIINLGWNTKNAKPIKNLYIYKRKKDEKYHLLRVLNSLDFKEILFVDKNLTINTEYNYIMQVEFKDASWSEYSEEISVIY